MNIKEIEKLLEDYKNNKVDMIAAVDILKKLPYEDLGYVKVDNHREVRNGYPEVIYCEGKSLDHIEGIINHMVSREEDNILATRASREVYDRVKKITKDVDYYEDARIILVNPKKREKTPSKIAILTGGTADIAVAEEAAVTAEVFGNRVERIYDVGVAGLHRLLSEMDRIQESKVIIAVAGMEGALASVVGGLIDKPVIAVPTSIGYGASFNGVAALLSMLNSCASGVSVVNIDNGFGAGYLASMINKL